MEAPSKYTIKRILFAILTYFHVILYLNSDFFWQFSLIFFLDFVSCNSDIVFLAISSLFPTILTFLTIFFPLNSKQVLIPLFSLFHWDLASFQKFAMN